MLHLNSTTQKQKWHKLADWNVYYRGKFPLPSSVCSNHISIQIKISYLLCKTSRRHAVWCRQILLYIWDEIKISAETPTTHPHDLQWHAKSMLRSFYLLISSVKWTSIVTLLVMRRHIGIKSILQCNHRRNWQIRKLGPLATFTRHGHLTNCNPITFKYADLNWLSMALSRPCVTQ